MKMIELKKQKSDEPKFDELYEMLRDLKAFFKEDVDFKDKEWKKNLDIILDFQDDDGSFKLFDSYKIPSDARVDFCHMPTYICTAALMKAYMTDSAAFTLKEKAGLLYGLKMSCAKNLWGHGYEGLKGQIEALNIFMEAGLNEFMDLHSDFCPQFSEMIKNISSKFQDMESEGKFLGPWGESYESQIKSINEYFCQRKVFVYGTLMSGECNHHYMSDSVCLGPATVHGYDMYDVGWYPAITEGDNLIIGELYQVPLEDMPSIDMLEGEGSLYAKKCETVTDAEGKTTFALVYVYLGDCSDLKRISSWKEYLWYVSYGSNMLEERFLRYIKGGNYGGKVSQPCDDQTLPLAVKAIEIPYDMYFGNKSGSWKCGVSFLDVTKPGNALAVAYLISKKQFNHIAAEENDGRFPDGTGNWYEHIIGLGMMDGFEVKTVTNESIRSYNPPSSDYLSTLFRGIKENWPDMSDKDIEEYLDACIR